MNRELIARIASETGDTSTDSKGRNTYEFDEHGLQEFLASIDAERGKEAAGFIKFVDNMIVFMPFKRVEDGDKLFLSPTIPECMALVPIEPTEAMMRAGERERRSHTGNMNPFHTCEAMLAAARGERNAD